MLCSTNSYIVCNIPFGGINVLRMDASAVIYQMTSDEFVPHDTSHNENLETLLVKA